MIVFFKGVKFVDDIVVLFFMMDVSVWEVGNFEYVIVLLCEDFEFKIGGMLVLFMDKGVYVFVVLVKISEDDLFVGLEWGFLCIFFLVSVNFYNYGDVLKCGVLSGFCYLI